jgi:GTP-binding protein
MSQEPYRVIRSDFVLSAPNLALCPHPTLPEIAIAGRSNVGKSSLINLVCQRKSLAKISGTPGKTRLINYFHLAIDPGGHELHLVDLPGYGYAKVSKKMRAEWDRVLSEFMEHRQALTGVIHLLDARHKPTQQDRQMREWIVHSGLPAITVMTKADKLKQSEREKNPQMVRSLLKMDTSEPLIQTSALKKQGVQEFLQALLDVLPENETP